MKIIKPSYEIINAPSYEDALGIIEAAIRVCYKSEEKMGEGTAEPLIRKVIKSGHHSTLEHVQFTFRFITSRGVTHELVRHRLVAFSQESTRYCDYGGGEVQYIHPSWIDDKCMKEAWEQYQAFKDRASDFHMAAGHPCYNAFRWLRSLEEIEKNYKELRTQDLAPQFARGVLPNDLKTEIIWSCNVRELRHIFNLRAIGTTGRPHPDIQGLMLPLMNEMKERYPVFFEDLEIKQ